MKQKATGLFVCATIFLILGATFIGVGFDKITRYENSESIWGENINAYVGGDAYNYIINGTYFAGYSALGGAMLISSCVCMAQGIKLKGWDELLETVNEINHTLKIGYSDDLEQEKKKEEEVKRILDAQKNGSNNNEKKYRPKALPFSDFV